MSIKKLKISKFNKIIISGIGVEGCVLLYKFYSNNLSNKLTLGNTVPDWFTLLILMIPISPLIGKVIVTFNKNKSSSDDLAEIISSIGGKDE